MVTNQRNLMIYISQCLECLAPLDFIAVLSMPSINISNYCKSQWTIFYINSNRKNSC